MDREKTLEIFSKGFKKYMERVGFTRDEIANRIGCKAANISKMKAGTGLPSVESLFSLVENGMKLEEIFGAELAEKLTAGLEPVQVDGKPEAYDTPEFRKGVADAIAVLMSKGIK